MPEYAWMCLYEQDSIYVLGPKYGKVLYLAGFSICESYTAFWIRQNMPWQSSEYILGFKYARILNLQELQMITLRNLIKDLRWNTLENNYSFQIFL